MIQNENAPAPGEPEGEDVLIADVPIPVVEADQEVMEADDGAVQDVVD